jgi:hypothetical protein
MAQELNVDIKVTGLSDLRSQLKAAKDDVIALQSSDIIDQKKLSEAIQRAGSLKDALNDANEQIKVMSGGSDFEKISSGLGLIGSQLRDMDFEGAANSAKLLTGTIKSMDPKAIADGFKDFAKTIGQLGNAFFQMGIKLLANPIFLLIAVVGAIVIAIVLLKDKVKILGDAFDLMMKPISILIQGLKDLTDWIGITSFADDEATDKFIENSKKKAAASKQATDDIVDDLNREINEKKARGEDTTKEELKVQAVLATTSAQRLRDLQADRDKIKKNYEGASKDRKKELDKELDDITKQKEEASKVYKDANSEFTVIEATKNKKDSDASKVSNANKIKAAKDYAAMRLQVERQIQDLTLSLMDEGLEKDLLKNKQSYDRKIEDTKRNEKLTNSEKIKLYKLYFSEKEKADKDAEKVETDKIAEKNKKIIAAELKAKEDLKKIREDFDTFILNESGTQLEKELGASKSKFDKERENLKNSQLTKSKIQQEFNTKEVALNIAQANEIDKIRKNDSERSKQTTDDEYNAKVDTITKFFATSQALLGSIGAFLNQNDSQRLANIQTQTDSENTLLDDRRNKELSQANLTESQKDAINKKYNQLKYKNELEAFKRSEEIKKKQFERDKALRMVSIVMDTATAVMRGFGEVGPVAGAILAGLTIATGAIQLATVASQKYQGAAGPSAPSIGGGVAGGSSDAITPAFSLTGNKNAGSTAQGPMSEVVKNENITVNAVFSETEVTDVQNRVKRIEERSQL